MIFPDYETKQRMKDEEFFHELGGRLAGLRQQAGLSQRELAGLLGLKQQTWATYENATRRLPASLILPLCSVLRVSSDQLLGASRARAKPGPVPRLRKQFGQINRLPKAKQDRISSVVEALLAQESASAAS